MNSIYSDWYRRKTQIFSSQGKFNNREINIEEFNKELSSGKYKLALEDGLPEKIKTMSNAHFYKNNGAICLTQEDGNEILINHIENKDGQNSEYKGAGKELLQFVVNQNNGKVMRLTAQGGNPKLINFYKQFGFEETDEECPYGVRMIKNSLILSMAKPWSDIQDKIDGHLSEMILHLVKIYYYHDFDEYIWHWVESVRKGFDKIPKRSDTNKFPTKDDIYNFIWNEQLSEDPDGLLDSDIEDINNVYTDVPEIPIETVDYEGFKRFLEGYINLLSTVISEKGTISMKQILDYVTEYDYGFSLKQ